MRRRILILLAAAVLAMVSVAAVVAYARGADRRALDGREGRYVLLATAAIPAGTTLGDIRTNDTLPSPYRASIRSSFAISAWGVIAQTRMSI